MMMNRNLDQTFAFKQTLLQPYVAYESLMDRLLEALLVRLNVRPAQLPALERRIDRALRKTSKRALDVTAALAALTFLAPLLLVVAVLVRFKLGSPIIFRQQRPGLHGEAFTIMKFRTMTDARDENGNLLDDEQRLTRFGLLLRSTSLDELPELFNVLRGEMSLVGPRPLMMQYLPLYSPEQARRHDILPGITGWAQIHGRNATTWEKRLSLDVWYVDNHSLWLDIKIIFATAFKVIQREGINQEGYTTMPIFTGTQNPSVQSTAPQA